MRTRSGSASNSPWVLALCSAIWLAGTDAGSSQRPDRTTVQAIPDHIWEAMQGKSWHAGRKCPARADLALLTVPFIGFDGQAKIGRLVVAMAEARRVASAMDRIFASRSFRIERMDLVDVFGGDDDASMAANNTSAFNCRFVGGTRTLSAHASGTAIDINPVQNPYVTRAGTFPPAGTAFDEVHERRDATTGLIRQGDVVTSAFASIGWRWGGDWTSKKDYQHFSRSGR